MDDGENSDQFHPLNVIQPEKWNNIPMCLIDAVRLMTSEVKSNELKIKFIQDKLLETQKRLEKQMKSIERQMNQNESVTNEKLNEMKELVNTNHKQLTFQLNLVSDRSSDNQYNIGQNGKKIEESNKFMRDTFKVKTECDEELKKLAADSQLQVEVSQTYMKEFVDTKITDALEVPGLVGPGRKYIDVRAMLKDLHNNYESKAALLNDISDNRDEYFKRICTKVVDQMQLPAAVKQLIKPEVKKEVIAESLKKMDEKLKIFKEENTHAISERVKTLNKELQEKFGILDEKFKILDGKNKDNLSKIDKKLNSYQGEIEKKVTELRRNSVTPENLHQIMRGRQPSQYRPQQSGGVSGMPSGQKLPRQSTIVTQSNSNNRNPSPQMSQGNTSKSKSPPDSPSRKQSSSHIGGQSKHSTMKEFDHIVPGYGSVSGSRPESRETDIRRAGSKKPSRAASQKGEDGTISQDTDAEGLEVIKSAERDGFEENSPEQHNEEDYMNDQNYDENNNGDGQQYEEDEFGNQKFQEFEQFNEDQDDYEYQMEAKFTDQKFEGDPNNTNNNFYEQFPQGNQFQSQPPTFNNQNVETQTSTRDKIFFGLENVDITKLEPHTMEFLKALEDELTGMKSNMNNIKDDLRLHLNYHYYNDPNAGGPATQNQANNLNISMRRTSINGMVPKKPTSFDQVLNDLKLQENDKNFFNQNLSGQKSAPKKLSAVALLRMIARRKTNESKIKQINEASKHKVQDMFSVQQQMMPGSIDSRVANDHQTPDSMSLNPNVNQETIQETKSHNEEDSPSKRVNKGIDATQRMNVSSDPIYSVDQLSDYQHINLPSLLKQPLKAKKAEIGFETNKPREQETLANRSFSRNMYYHRKAATSANWRKRAENILGTSSQNNEV